MYRNIDLRQEDRGWQHVLWRNSPADPVRRVQDVHPGKDGVVRVVTLRTTNGLLKRPVNKLCPLPTNQ
ncbi:unnamed protein product [Parnassius mnemosyne]|uniref:DUF5641 domain-containing protein n=1 Tax=Parnassius mnemosyne TaxID=213953 RepID=A0AAV1KH69_9NEOP